MNLRIFLLVVLSLAMVLGQRREEQIRRQQIRRQEIRQGQIIRQRQTSHGQTSHGQTSHGQTQIRQSSSHGQTSQGQTRVRQSQSRQSQSGGRLGQGSTTRRRIITESQRRITQSQSRDRRCAPGYYRARTGPYLGVCVPCQCNGRADTCDPDTGECINCRNNFGGPQCLTCKQGHYYDERTRRCEICACPMRVESNNFARTCQVYPQTGEVFRCECLPGYTGARCDSCDLGYWGNPNEIGGSCQACQCNDNIDVRDPRSCDPYTGACQICINNAAGPNCERCADWYYGDAVRAKNCRACTCNRAGTESCDHRSGACLCKPNVIGRECDRCAYGSFGFERGQGCEVCDCAIGASSTECDPYTGQCTCHIGVTGRRCDSCMPGYWNFGPNGCERCQCGSDGANSCDPRTGRCECLPGVAGARCGRCLDRWIFLPDQGCQECDSCIHLLLDDLEIMDHNVGTMVGELGRVSVGVGAIRRLDQINETVRRLRPLVDGLIRDPRNGALDPLWRELEKLKELKERVWNRAQRTDNEADVVLRDAMKTDRDASDLLVLVREATTETNNLVRALISIFTTGYGGSVAFAQEVLQDILNSIQSQNVDAIIAEAERILEEIKSRDFMLDERAANDEYGLANETLRRVQELFNRAMEQADEINRIAGKLDGVEDKLRDLLNNSRHSIDNSQAASDLTKRGEGKKQQIQGDILAIKELRDDISMMLGMAQQLVDDARAFLDEAREAHFATERESTRLEAAMDDLRDFVDNLAAHNEKLRPLVDEAMKHALDLQKQAEMLARILEDTKISAGGAVNASRAYQAIVDAINDADAASRAALESAIEALEFSNGLAERARRSKLRSQELKTESQETKDRVRDELRPRLREAKRSVTTVERLNQETEDGLTNLLIGLDMLPDGGYGDRAQEAAMKAMDAQQRAEEAANKIEDILDKLPEDQRKINEIPKDIADANRDIQRAQNQVDQVLRLIPDATQLIDRLTIQAEKVNGIGQDLTVDITALREKIKLSREEASRIRVGVTFMRNTTLQLRSPKSLAQAGSYTKLSIFFKTSERNGFLAYIGQDRTSDRLQTDDFMALEIIDGKVVFKFDLGAGTTRITNSKDVSDNEWHEAIVERTGKTVSLIVRTEDEDDSVEEATSPGTFSVLDLDPDSSKFYVGGVPENVGLENKLDYMRFVGCIEDVKFDGLPIGMWDFVHGENNNRGCLSRDKLLGAVTNGFRFDGNGVVVLDRDRFRPSKAGMISLKFKTYADNGLMLLVGEDGDFMSLELHDGKVLFQYDLGSGRAMLESTESYSDGQWHTVVANRLKQDGLVKVDGVTVATGRSPGDLKELSITDDIFIGGYRGQHNYPTVTQQGFDGCIKDVQLGSAVRDINDNTYALGVLPGCPEVARIVSLSREVGGSYIAMDPVNVDQDFQATMKIKTLERDGLIFYVADDTQSNSFSVSVVDGRIVVSSNPEGIVTELSTDIDTYSDGHWHYITVTKSGRNLQLDVDDSEMVKTRADGRRRIVTTSPLYFGGVPPGYAIVSQNVGSERGFGGCIGDVTVKGAFVNFAVAPTTNRRGAVMTCPIPDPTPPTTPPPIWEPLSIPPGIDGEGGDSREQCALPLRPEEGGVDSGDASGTRFGAHPDSRLEYLASEIPGNTRSESEFSFEFKSTGRDGILFYAYGDRHVDFIAVYLTVGQVNYAFNCGSGTAKITSPRTYNDGRWHSVVFWRRQARGRLVIDEEEVGEGRSGGNQKSINVVSPFFVGGLARDPRETVVMASSNMDGITQGFSGCIRNIQLDGIPFGTPTEHHVEPCTSSVESGSFFSADGGYIALDEQFKVGLDLDITLEIKPRSLSGVIMSVFSSRGDYLVIQMQDGNIIFSVDNGGGAIETTYNPPAKNGLCDGGWHTIKAVKAKNVVTLYVDEVFTYPGIGEAGVSSTDTNDPLYIGGVPEYHKGIKTRVQFVGCIRNLQFNSRVQNLSGRRVSGQVNANSCPTT